MPEDFKGAAHSAEEPIKLGALPQTPVRGNCSIAIAARWPTLQEDTSQRQPKDFKPPFDFGAEHARVRPWVMNPSVDWACSFLLDPMRILHHALSKIDMCR